MAATCFAYSQSVPEGINYQAVARDNAGTEIANTAIMVRFSIGTSAVSNSTYAYQETHSSTTNQLGLFNVVIGQGTPSGGSNSFSVIPWDNPQYLLVEVDFGSGFEQMGVATPFVAVPYAMLSKDVLNKELPQTATTNDVLTWNGSQWVPLAPGSATETTTTLVDNADGTFTYTNEAGTPVTFDANINDADADATNEIQDLQLVGNTLTITNNGTATPIDLSIYNELPSTATSGQVLTWNGSAWVAQNSGTGADNWGSQTVVTDGTLSGDGTSGNPLSGFDGDYANLSNTPTIPTATSELTNDSGFLTTEVDGSTTNEIQNLSVSGNNLNISSGTGTTISTNTPAAGQILTWNGTSGSWEAQNPGSGADNWGSQTVVTDATLSGDGTSGSPLSGFDGDYVNLSNTPTIPTATSELTNDSGFLTAEVDGSTTNELNTGFAVNGANLELTDASGTLSVPLSSLSTPDSDWTVSGSNIYNNTESSLGFGTSSPQYRLHVHEPSGTSISTAYFTNANNPQGTNFGIDINGNTMIRNYLSTNMSFYTSNLERLRILNNGDIGIGTTTPDSRVHIASTGPSGLTLESASGNDAYLDFQENGSLRSNIFWSSAENRMRIEATGNDIILASGAGNVGIGTGSTAPVSTLDVNGQITMQNGASSGYIPVSDANGTMTWTDPSTITTGNDGDWTKSGSNTYNTTDNIGIGTSVPSARLTVVSGGSSSSTSALNITNSSSSPLLNLRDDGLLALNTTTPVGSANLVVNDNDNSGYGGINVNSDDLTTGRPFYGFAVNGSPLAWSYLDVADANKLKFYHGGDRMTITSSGDVGIGTTSPPEKLSISEGNLSMYRSTGDDVQIYMSGDDNGIGWSVGVEDSDAGFFKISTSSSLASSTRMTITDAGNVGISSTSPQFRLHVEDNITRRAGYFFNNTNAANVAFNEIMGIYGGAHGTGASDKIGGYFEASSGSGINYGVYGYASGGSQSWAGYFSAGDVYIANSIGVNTTALGGYKVRIENSSETRGLHVQTSTSNSTAYGGYLANSHGGTSFGYGSYASSYGSGTGSKIGAYGRAYSTTSETKYGVYGYAGGSGTLYAGYFSGSVYTTGSYLPSDEKLKTNIQDYEGAIDQVMNIDVKKYNYRQEGTYQEMNLPKGEQVGFIADNLEKEYPTLVKKTYFESGINSENPDEEQGETIEFNAVNYSGMVPVLTKATQEQQLIINDLMKQVEELKMELEKLKNDNQ